MITKEELIACIKAATVTKTVKVPATCYYSRPGDTDDERISYVDPDLLAEEIRLS